MTNGGGQVLHTQLADAGVTGLACAPDRDSRTALRRRRPLHDIHPTSVAAVPHIPHTLTTNRYHFVTVSQQRATL
jgi:hypothetical protein